MAPLVTTLVKEVNVPVYRSMINLVDLCSVEKLRCAAGHNFCPVRQGDGDCEGMILGDLELLTGSPLGHSDSFDHNGSDRSDHGSVRALLRWTAQTMTQEINSQVGINLIFAFVGIFLGLPIGQAFSPLVGWGGHGAVSLQDAVDDALDRTDWHIFRRLLQTFSPSDRERRQSGDDGRGDIFLAVIAIIFILTQYVQHAVEVASVIAGTSVLVALVVTAAFFILWRRAVVDGASFVTRLTVIYLAVGVGVISAVWLLDPPRHGDALDSLTAAIHEHGSILAAGGNNVGVIFTQVIAAFFTFTLLVASIALSLGAVSAVYVHTLGERKKFWLVAFWCNRWAMPAGRWWALFFFGLLALLMASGAGYDGLRAIMNWFSDRVADIFPSPEFSSPPS